MLTVRLVTVAMLLAACGGTPTVTTSNTPTATAAAQSSLDAAGPTTKLPNPPSKASDFETASAAADALIESYDTVRADYEASESAFEAALEAGDYEAAESASEASLEAYDAVRADYAAAYKSVFEAADAARAAAETASAAADAGFEAHTGTFVTADAVVEAVHITDDAAIAWLVAEGTLLDALLDAEAILDAHARIIVAATDYAVSSEADYEAGVEAARADYEAALEAAGVGAVGDVGIDAALGALAALAAGVEAARADFDGAFAASSAASFAWTTVGWSADAVFADALEANALLAAAASRMTVNAS